jgi:hypothetical protein
VFKANKASKAKLDHKVFRVKLDRLGLQDQQVLLVPQALQALLVLLDHKAHPPKVD